MQPSSSQRPTTDTQYPSIGTPTSDTPYPSIGTPTTTSVSSPIQAEVLEDMFPFPPTTSDQIPVVGKPDGTTADDSNEQSTRPPFASSIFQPSDSFPEIISVGAVKNNTNVSASTVTSTDSSDDSDGGGDGDGGEEKDPGSGCGRSVFQHYSHHSVDAMVFSFMIIYVGGFLVCC